MSNEGWWSERIVFGLLIIVGYLLLVVLTLIVPVVVASNVPADKLVAVMAAVTNSIGIVKDSLLVIGPLLGVIVNSIWKADRADKQNAQALATLATAAVASAPAAPEPPTSRFP